jgi:hypothetical protein
VSKHDQIIAAVTGMCHQRGFSVHYCGSSIYCAGKGFPDLFICGNAYALFAEIKVDQFSKVSSDQTTWGHKLQAAGEQYRRWYVADLESGLIEFELDRMAA